MAPDTSNKQRYTAALLEVPGMAFDISISDPKERIQAYIDTFRQPSRTGEKRFDESFMANHIKIISATGTPGKATAVFEMKAATEFTSRMGNFHGGAIALIFDMCTTMCAAPLARENFWVFGGVSRVLSITYLRPVREHMDLLIECEVLQQGSRLTTIRGQMKDKSDGRLLAVAEHNKASIDFVDPKSKM